MTGLNVGRPITVHSPGLEQIDHLVGYSEIRARVREEPGTKGIGMPHVEQSWRYMTVCSTGLLEDVANPKTPLSPRVALKIPHMRQVYNAATILNSLGKGNGGHDEKNKSYMYRGSVWHLYKAFLTKAQGLFQKHNVTKVILELLESPSASNQNSGEIKCEIFYDCQSLGDDPLQWNKILRDWVLLVADADESSRAQSKDPNYPGMSGTDWYYRQRALLENLSCN